MSKRPDVDLGRYLRPGERLLWTGRPDPTVLFAPADLFVVPFSLLWGGFAISAPGSLVVAGASLFDVLFGALFACAGAYFIAGRFGYKVWKKRRTAYGITPQRALVAVGHSKVQDVPILSASTAVRHTRNRRHVTVTFRATSGRLRPASQFNLGMDLFTFGEDPVAFYDVAEPEALLVALDRATTSVN